MGFRFVIAALCQNLVPPPPCCSHKLGLEKFNKTKIIKPDADKTEFDITDTDILELDIMEYHKTGRWKLI